MTKSNKKYKINLSEINLSEKLYQKSAVVLRINQGGTRLENLPKFTQYTYKTTYKYEYRGHCAGEGEGKMNRV
jgi:hypothetical protein